MLASTVRVLVVDDYAPWRRFVALVLGARAEIQVVGEAADGSMALQRVSELQPDIVILDLWLPDMNGIDVCRQILTIAPKTKIALFAEDYSHELVKNALSNGAHGYVVKSDAARDLLAATTALLAGDYFVSPRAISRRR